MYIRGAVSSLIQIFFCNNLNLHKYERGEIMIRFRNPGTQFDTQVHVIQILYENLNEQDSFTLQDMASVIAQERLMTAYGYAGDAALALSNTENESMNSALMNAKMYAEVFRMLGWVTPSGEKSYPLEFTYIGAHVALAKGDVKKLYEQCVFGINNPNELTARMSYTEQVRFFKCALHSFIDLDGIMYKHELSLGPMSVNDVSATEYDSMIARIKALRGNATRLKKAFLELAASLNMKPTPVDNCTRLPVALLKSCGLVVSYATNKLYPPRKMECLRITKHGKEAFAQLETMKDLRIDEFNSYDKDIQNALIRLGIYSMLQRAGYDTSPVEEIMSVDEALCHEILQEKSLLFSPYQTIRHDKIDEAMGFSKEKTDNPVAASVLDESKVFVGSRTAVNAITNWDLDVETKARLEWLNLGEDADFLNRVNELVGMGKNKEDIVKTLFEYYSTAKQGTFYPLISTLFKIMGFQCAFSRPGDNGARWDAIIDDERRSIPIEIKSPTEEEHISVKAIRQAVENKIVLLSRRTHITEPGVTTLAVGYRLPNERAEVSRLIQDFKNTYGIKVGVIDLYALLTVAISILIDGVGFDKEKLYGLEGMISANS